MTLLEQKNHTILEMIWRPTCNTSTAHQGAAAHSLGITALEEMLLVICCCNCCAAGGGPAGDHWEDLCDARRARGGPGSDGRAQDDLRGGRADLQAAQRADQRHRRACRLSQSNTGREHSSFSLIMIKAKM